MLPRGRLRGDGPSPVGGPGDARVLTGLCVKAVGLKSRFDLFPKGADGLVFISRSSG